jgi:wobble nucleotide-excising tRNase
MIKNIKLKNVATYDDDGSEILGLTNINFIYGTNGSGKTTLSNFIANQEDYKFKECSIKWEQNQPIKALVYNKEFRDKNFGKDNIDGIFTLGEATKEDKNLILQKQKELTQIAEDGKQKKLTLKNQQTQHSKLQEEFKERCWKNIYKKYEDNFKEAFKGSLQKNSFRDKVLNEFKNNSSELLTKEKLIEKAKIIFGDIPQSLNLIYNIDYKIIIQIEENPIWTKKIIGKNDVDIAKLIQKLNLNDWVNQGRNFLQNDDICPFCQQNTITEDFKKQLENYFDKSFTEDIEIINTLAKSYLNQIDNIENQLSQIFESQKNNSNSKLNIDIFMANFETLKSQFLINKKTLDEKLKEPSRSLSLISTNEQLNNIAKLINDANIKTKEHNQIVLNYKTEKEKLIGLIWKFITSENNEYIESFLKQSNGLDKGIKILEKDYKAKQDKWKSLNNEIKELNKNVTSIQPTVDEINKLINYYGFTNFAIVPSTIDKNKYQIKREDGSLAEATLSEGEITFITFLYYLQLTKGAIEKESVSDNRILVIDDPISSLDSDILFVVSSLIKNIINEIKDNTGNIKQLIVLTHNVYFHKEVSFMDMRDNGGKHTHYWIVRKNNNISTFTAYERNNPIQTSYQLLWQEIQDKEKNSIVTIQNTMRRIIENYFKILGDYNKIIIDKFDDYEEQIICKSLLSWINDGSHSISDDLYVEIQDNTIDKYLEVFKQIFIKTDHSGHYNMMMQIENGENNAN